MPTLDELLATSEALEEKLASASSDDLRRKKAYVDFAAFGEFKKAEFWPAAKKALGWGAGLGVPALATGLILEHNAKSDANEVVNNLRNQALMTAMALGPAYNLGRTSMASADDDTPQKLAAALLLDDVLESQLAAAASGEKQAVEACLLLNREHGTALLRKLRR